MINNISNRTNSNSKYLQNNNRVAFSGVHTPPAYFATVASNSKQAGNFVWEHGKFVLQPAREFLTKIFNSEPIQKLAGNPSFGAIWANIILIGVNMTVRPICVLLEKDKTKSKHSENNKEVQNDDKSKKAAKIYTAARLFLQEGFGLAAMGAFLLYPIPKHIGWNLGKRLAGPRKAEIFNKFTVQNVQKLMRQNKDFKPPSIIEKSFRMGEAITTIVALSFLGPMLNNMAVNPFLKMIGVDISSNNKENKEKTKEA